MPYRRIQPNALFKVFFCVLLSRTIVVAETPKEWIEPATGHRVVRLSEEAGSGSLYFHQSAYTPQGDKLIITTPSGLATVNLRNRQVEVVVPKNSFSGGGSSGIEMGRKTRQVYYSVRGETGTVVRATHVDTKVTRDVVRLPFFAAFNGVSADEKFIVGTFSENRGGFVSPTADPVQSLDARTRLPRSMKFYYADVRTGEVKFFHPSTNWLNHGQCSPTDATMFLFCHEGNWHDVDRVWTIRLGSDDAKLMHRRTMKYEIAGHEFFGHDGKWVWYDLQTPRSQEFWLAGVNLDTGERIRYAAPRNEWSVHYNVSWDGKLFAGDGGGPDSVANKSPLPEAKRLDPPQNGQWIYLFRPAPDFETKTIGGEKVKVGKFIAEKLVDLSKHDYRLEPNVTFTPDGKWIVFRSNMHGERHAYAVEVAKAARPH
jgi:oligogalacturonide lyase